MFKNAATPHLRLHHWLCLLLIDIVTVWNRSGATNNQVGNEIIEEVSEFQHKDRNKLRVSLNPLNAPTAYSVTSSWFVIFQILKRLCFCQWFTWGVYWSYYRACFGSSGSTSMVQVQKSNQFPSKFRINNTVMVASDVLLAPSRAHEGTNASQETPSLATILYGLALHLMGYVAIGTVIGKSASLFQSESTNHNALAKIWRKVLHGSSILRWIFAPRERTSCPETSISSSGMLNRIPEGILMLCCFLGLNIAYVTWGFFQEQIMTQSYTSVTDGTSKKFQYSEMLVRWFLHQKIINLTFYPLRVFSFALWLRFYLIDCPQCLWRVWLFGGKTITLMLHHSNTHSLRSRTLSLHGFNWRP